jgi:hypothetical protein
MMIRSGSPRREAAGPVAACGLVGCSVRGVKVRMALVVICDVFVWGLPVRPGHYADILVL